MSVRSPVLRIYAKLRILGLTLCMFTPLEILYIVLAFCALWISAALFWLIFQAASLLKNVNDFILDTQERMHAIEEAISSIRHRVEASLSGVPVVVTGLKKVMDYAMEKGKDWKKMRTDKHTDEE